MQKDSEKFCIAPFFFILVIWQFNTFFIPVFYTLIFKYNMYMKLFCIIEIVIHFLYNISMNFLRIILRIIFGCLLFLSMLLFLCVIVNILQVSYLCFPSFNDCSSPSCSALLRVSY